MSIDGENSKNPSIMTPSESVVNSNYVEENKEQERFQNIKQNQERNIKSKKSRKKNYKQFKQRSSLVCKL